MDMDESKRVKPETPPSSSGELDAAFDSPALRRLLDEVRFEEEEGGVPRSYNRTFNRHNR